MGIILSIIGDFLSIAQKHSKQKIEHHRLERNYNISVQHGQMA